MAKRSSASVSPAVASTPKRARASMRHQMQLSFQSESSRDSFLARVDSVKKRLFLGRTVDNVQFLTTLLDRLETTGGMVDEAQCSRTVNSVSMLDSSGLYKLYCKLNENINTV